jgi:tricorn protease
MKLSIVWDTHYQKIRAAYTANRTRVLQWREQEALRSVPVPLMGRARRFHVWKEQNSSMPSQGYVRFPTLYQNRIVFVAEDDLWQVASEGGRAERLTAGVSETRSPRFSPDGAWLAFLGREEGPDEVYLMSIEGSEARRLTFQGVSNVVGWSPEGETILFASSARSAHSREDRLYAVNTQGGEAHQLPVGLANAISYGPHGGVVIGRNIGEPARWKRYRGGTAGYLWCDVDGNGEFRRLLRLAGNMASPCWVGERIYFLSDHEGVGNVYSCTPAGEDVQRHTSHEDFYARNLTGDGQRMVYHAGADLYLFDPQNNRSKRVEISLPSARTQLSRKFVPTTRYLQEYALHPEGYATALVARGKTFSMGNWEGPVLQHGEPDGVRYRLLSWLKDGKRMVAVQDAGGLERLVIFSPEEKGERRVLDEVEFGHALDMVVSPTEDVVAIANQRHELILVELANGQQQIVDRSEYMSIQGIAWSPDGRWLAYGFALTAQRVAIKLFGGDPPTTRVVTRPVLRDAYPSFDPEGKYLYFIGQRVFNPVPDNLEFGWSFPRGEKPYALLLRRELRSPFVAVPRAPNGKEEKGDEVKNGDENAARENGANPDKAGSESGFARPLVIDLEGIEQRIVPFPVSEGRYGQVRGLKGKVLLLSFPLAGSVAGERGHEPAGQLGKYDFDTLKYEMLADGVNSFEVARDGKMLIYRARQRLRVFKAGEKPGKGDNGERPNRETGWLDLNRVKVSVLPGEEWKQMFAEAWRLQRDYFWAEDMSGVDWPAVYARYAPLVERVSSRAELSDLFWEMHGELGTSHAYEMGGEYRKGPHYGQGYLGVDWQYDVEHDRYRLARIVEGDPAETRETSPLTAPGLNVEVGDAVLAVNGQRVGRTRSPQELLVNQAGCEVQLTIEDGESGEARTIIAKALSSEQDARYREWVENNRQRVHALSQERVGYIHIPNMGQSGFAEFHRGFLAEYDAPALLIDVRWNGGGNVSGLLLNKLARHRLGYDFSRWDAPMPYPLEAPRGPMVALTDEHAGSDGDMFCHSFKLMGLGPLLGKRTWGGVIGYMRDHQLVDGTMITEPECSFWFKDVGWSVENYGTEPDIEVDIAPQDYARGADPQLEQAIEEALKQLESGGYLEPQPGERPHLGRQPR